LFHTRCSARAVDPGEG